MNTLTLESQPLEGKVTGITPLIDHNSEDDLYDAVAAAVLDPQFSQALANVVSQNDDDTPGVQNFIQPPAWQRQWMETMGLGNVMFGINPQAPPDVQNFLGPLLTTIGGVLGQLIFSGLPTSAAPGSYPQALPPHIEQGIFSMLGKVLTNPIFTGIVKDIATEVCNDVHPSGSQS